MSKLDVIKRPTVLFDVKNAEHRKHFYTFIQNKTWKDCPVRFTVEDAQGACTNVVVQITDQITQFQLQQEFKKKSYQKRKTNATQIPASTEQ